MQTQSQQGQSAVPVHGIEPPAPELLELVELLELAELDVPDALVALVVELAAPPVPPDVVPAPLRAALVLHATATGTIEAARATRTIRDARLR